MAEEKRTKYRLYVDEVGNSDMSATLHPTHQYLSLTGIILDLNYVDATVFPALENLKRRYFGSHPDEPIILHRKEMVHKNYPFAILRDPTVCAAFDKDLLSLLQDFGYVVITAVIDKMEHYQRYQTWRYDPYHYCLTVIIERYVRWLRTHRSTGDVMAESRGGAEDRRLKEVFREIYQNGTEYLPPDRAQQCLTSKELKVKPKGSNVAGLQLADLLAHPSFQATKAVHNGESPPPNFGGKIAAILEEAKYYRGRGGKIDGYGQKWLP